MSTTVIRPQEKTQKVPWSFLYMLRESGLLSGDRLDQLERQADTLDLPTMSTLLLENEWLTPYQLKRVLEGQVRGLLLGQYRVLDELGEGGFGKVYKAVHGMMNRLAAVKVISPKWAQHSKARDLFLREVLAITRLAHPNIALAYEANQTDDVLWFAMEYVDGSNLEQFVAERGPMPVSLACAVMHQVARALDYAHENGMVHRDVKPANLLLAGAGSLSEPAAFRPGSADVLVKVVDFGLAKLFPFAAPHAPSICQDGARMGTPEYMSPEQARNSHLVDIRSDLYSLGCTFYFALTGRPPFQGHTTAEILSQQLEREPAPLLSLRPELPPDVANIVHRLMAKKPEQRFSSPADLVESLSVALRKPRQQGAPSPPARPAQVLAPLASDTIPVLASVEPAAAPTREQGLSKTRVLETIALQAGPDQPPAPKAPVAVLWREWVAVVAAFAQRTGGPGDEREYGALYKALLSGLRDVADHPSHPQARLYARLAELVEPWLRLRALADLDPTTRMELWQTCRRMDAELCPAPRLPFWASVSFLILLAAAAALVATLLFPVGR